MSWEFEGSLPVYKQIIEELRRRIFSGSWPPGTRLPLETELSEEFGVARMTMNKALSILQRQGLIVRRKRLGTIVNTPRVRTAELKVVPLRRFAMEKGLRYDLRYLLQEARQSTVDERDSFGFGEEVLEIRAVHLFDGRATAVEQRVICLKKLPQARAMNLSEQSPEEWLNEALPWGSTAIMLKPVSVDLSLGQFLEVRPGTAAMQMERKLQFQHQIYAIGRLTAVGAAAAIPADQVAHS